jgi:hypothetical protein
MFKKMQRAMQEIAYFQKLRAIVGEKIFEEGVEIAKSYLQGLGYKQAKKLIETSCRRALLFGDVEDAKKFAVAIEVLEDVKRNQKA